MKYIKKITIKTYPSNIEVYDDSYHTGRIYTRCSDMGKAYIKYVQEEINDNLYDDGYRISRKTAKKICNKFNNIIIL